MRVVVQRVTGASVTANEAVVGRIGRGLMLLVGVHAKDTISDVQELAKRVLALRIFQDPSDAAKRFARSVLDEQLSILVVSQFTLYARADKGAKLDFHEAMSGPSARVLFDSFVSVLRAAVKDPASVQTGAFGECMAVQLVNDGPATLILESKAYLASD